MKSAAQPGSPAGFWKRYVAYSIDLLLVYAVLEVVSQLFFPGMDARDMDHLQSLVVALQNPEAQPQEQSDALLQVTSLLSKLMLLSSLAYAVIAGCYFVLCESSRWQATLGKRAVGIKVVAGDGSRIGAGRAIGRFLAAALSWLTMNIGHALAAWTPERRALHDLIADTRVVNADPDHPGMPTWGWLIVGAQGLLFLLVVIGAAVAMVHAIDAAGQI